MSDARVVDQDVELAKSPPRRREQPFNLDRIAHIADYGQNSDFASRQLPCSLVQGRLLASGDNQITAFTRQCFGHSQADTLTRAGNECDLPTQTRAGSHEPLVVGVTLAGLATLHVFRGS